MEFPLPSAVSLPSVFFFQAEDGIRDRNVTGVQTCALPIWAANRRRNSGRDRLGRRGQVGGNLMGNWLAGTIPSGITRTQPGFARLLPLLVLTGLAAGTITLLASARPVQAPARPLDSGVRLG